jgi:hypothetical protein
VPLYTIALVLVDFSFLSSSHSTREHYPDGINPPLPIIPHISSIERRGLASYPFIYDGDVEKVRES